jgi:predicted transcriptional regulator
LEVEVTRVRLSVDVDPELRRRVRMAAASKDQSVKEWLESVLERELKRTDEDIAWMEADLSRLGRYEPYEWAEGELEDETPVRYEPGRGLRVEKPGGKRRA